VNTAGAAEINNIGCACVRWLTDADLNAHKIANSEPMPGHPKRTDVGLSGFPRSMLAGLDQLGGYRRLTERPTTFQPVESFNQDKALAVIPHENVHFQAFRRILSAKGCANVHQRSCQCVV
jgi:hypothetical protein